MVEEEDRVTGYRDSSVVSKSGPVNLTPEANSNTDTLPEGFNEDVDWDHDGAKDKGHAQRVGVRRELLDLQDNCQANKRRVLTNFTQAVQFTYELLQPSDAPVNSVPLSEVPVTTEGDTTEIVSELDKAK